MIVIVIVIVIVIGIVIFIVIVIVFQGLELKFPVDNEMLKGCYGNRPSCLAKDLPAEVSHRENPQG